MHRGFARSSPPHRSVPPPRARWRETGGCGDGNGDDRLHHVTHVRFGGLGIATGRSRIQGIGRLVRVSMKAIQMSTKPTADELLFGRGMTVEDYYISKTPVSEEICFIGPGGRAYTLLIHDIELYKQSFDRLRELGVREVYE